MTFAHYIYISQSLTLSTQGNKSNLYKWAICLAGKICLSLARVMKEAPQPCLILELSLHRQKEERPDEGMFIFGMKGRPGHLSLLESEREGRTSVIRRHTGAHSE